MQLVQILRLLWRIIQTYFRFKRNMNAIRSGNGGAESMDATITAYKKGDYEAAFFKTIDPYLKGVTLMQMGQLGGALPLLKHAADTANDPRAGAMANNALGQLFVEDKQYVGAQECFRTSQILWQERGGADRGMAEMWLRRGENSEEALRLARRGLEKERAHPGFSVETKNASLCEQLGTLAWAVAVEVHDTAEVNRLVSEGLGLTASNPVSSTALMHLHFGHAYAALGDAEKAVQHYDEAARLDPKGLAGRAAAIAMPVPARQ